MNQTTTNIFRVAVWGTGNVGRPAIRCVVANDQLELAGVIVNAPTKVGRDAGELAELPPTGVLATDDIDAVLFSGLDAIVYSASADFRPDDAIADIERCLHAGVNVVSPGVYPLLHPMTVPADLARRIDAATSGTGASVFVSGIDPGWGMDLLPLVLSGVCGQIDELRAQEVFNYSTYHAPDAVRELIGFGGPLDVVPPMLWNESLLMVWGPMLRIMADGLGLELDDIRTLVERRPLERTIDVPGMGRFDEGTQGAFRFEVQGIVGGQPRLVAEHVTRIDDSCAPDWPQPPPGKVGCHRVVISGRPHLEVTVSADDGTGNPAEGGNATAAGRLVNAIPAVCAAAPGIVHPLDLPLITGRGLF